MADAPTPAPGDDPGASAPAGDDDVPAGPLEGETVDAADEVVPDPAEVFEHPADDVAPPTELLAERDEYRDAFLRVKADFENYKRRQSKDSVAAVDRAVGALVERLLPVLDACDAATSQGAEGAEPIAGALIAALEGQGLERLDAPGETFDPTLHEAVLREEGDGEQVVVEVLRPGYRWNGNLIRAAMVKVKG